MVRIKARNKLTGVIVESDNEMVLDSWKRNPDYEFLSAPVAASESEPALKRPRKAVDSNAKASKA